MLNITFCMSFSCIIIHFFCKKLQFMPKEEKNIEDRVISALKNIDLFSGCGAVYHSIGGSKQPLMGQALCRLCQACVKHSSAGSFCRHEATSGAYQSFVTGEVYYTKCWLGLHCLVMPIAPDGKKVIGAIEIGGLLAPGELQSGQHSIIGTLNAVAKEDNLANFINAFQGLEEIPYINIENLKSFLLETMFSTGLLDSSTFETNNAAWKQQQRLSDAVKSTKSLSVDKRRKSILILTDKLVSILKTSDEKRCVETIDKVLSIALGSKTVNDDDVDIKSVKAFLLPVISAISMDSLLSKEKWNGVMVKHTRRIDEMAEISDIKELCFWFESMILNILEASPAEDPEVDKLLSDKLLEFFHKHYHEQVYMEDVAKYLGASSSSVMHKVKKETGKTFSQLLNGVRVKEAKRLLTFTTLPLGEISLRCGFKDQSYFTKVFMKYINIGPREFRNMLKMNMVEE